MLRSHRLALATALAVAGCSVAAGALNAQQGIECGDTALDEREIKELLSAGVGPPRLRQWIETCGLAIALPDGGSLDALRNLGASPAHIAALSPPPAPAAGARWSSPFDRRAMVYIPPGRFQMGSPASEPSREPDEGPTDVQIANGFWLDTTEVTNDAYRRFVIARPDWQKDKIRKELHDGDYLKDWNGTTYPAGEGDLPVVWVSWHAARAYAAWAGKRLPTEAEWEYAARAGASTPYWWGEKFEARRVSAARKPAAPDALRLRTNPWGIQDAIGGVWEWTASLNRPYPYVAGDGRENPRTEGPRIIRGGSWANGEAFLRLSNRNWEQMSRETDLLGLRCAR